jgi:YbbR domain-containing protein
MMERTSLLNGSKLLAKVAENWPAKVLSVALAIILFVFHRMSMLEERFFSVPLQVETSGHLVPSSSYPRMIRVSLRGDANSIYPIVEDDIEAYIDLTKYTDPGRYRAPVQIRRKGTAQGVDALEIGVDPLEVSVELDQRISKYVPLTPNFQGHLEPGYELVSYTLEPAQAVIDGPLGLVGGIFELSTDFIELSGRNADFSATVRILNRDPLMVIRGNGTAEFRGFVRELIIIQNFDNLPIEINGLRDPFVAEPELSFGSVRLEGGQNDFEGDTAAGIVLSLDCSGITGEGIVILPLSVLIPPMFTLIRADPEQVMVQVRRKPELVDEEDGGDE